MLITRSFLFNQLYWHGFPSRIFWLLKCLLPSPSSCVHNHLPQCAQYVSSTDVHISPSTECFVHLLEPNFPDAFCHAA